MNEQQNVAPITVFYSYARSDRKLCEQLQKHLSLLRQQGVISEWYDHQIVAGTDWAHEISIHLNTATIVLLLVSPDFLASNYCYSIEMQQALARHEAGKACVIPIILRPTDLTGAPFTHLQYLPLNGKAITSWHNRDDALRGVAKGIREATEQLRTPFPGISRTPKRISILDETAARHKYLKLMREQHSSVKLPIGRDKRLSLQAVFQPLKLRLDPLAAEDLVREERRVLLDEIEGVSDNADMLLDMNHQQIDNPSQQEPFFLIAENSDDALSKSPQRRMIILGGPGTGKTTLLKYLLGDRAYKAEGDPDAAIPIFISLPEFARSDKTLKDYLLKIVQDMMIDDRYADVLWRAIETGHAFVCLDSLDEVVNQRAEMIRNINTYISASSVNTTWIVGSRFTSYKGGELTREQLTEWELQPMNHLLRLQLAERLLPQLQYLMPLSVWGIGYEPSAFVNLLETHPRVSAWGKNPLLFSLAVLVFTRLGELPNSLAELYQLVINEILETRERLPEQRSVLCDLLGTLSLELYLERKGRTFTLDELSSLIRKIRRNQGESWSVEEAIRRIINSGMLEVVAAETYGFLHQTFQEYLGARYIASLARIEAEQEINRLVDCTDEPFCRQVVVDLVHIANQRDLSLEEYLYQRVIVRLGSAKMKVLAAQREGRNPSFESPIVAGITYLLEDLIDLWGLRLCSTLENGTPYQVEDGEVASTISGVFERNPRNFAVPSLIAGLYKYEKRGRFIGALGKVGTEQAKAALFAFTREQIDHPNDPYVFQYLAAALGEARVEQAISLLQVIRDRDEYKKGARREARLALQLLGQENIPGEEQPELEEILEALCPVDEKGRPSDYKRAINASLWLQQAGLQEQLVQSHHMEILPILEKAFSHQHDEVREAVTSALGELGNSQTFSSLAKSLIEHNEPSLNVVKKILAALIRLVERDQVNAEIRESIIEIFPKIQLAYPALIQEISRTRFRIQNSELS